MGGQPPGRVAFRFIGQRVHPDSAADDAVAEVSEERSEFGTRDAVQFGEGAASYIGCRTNGMGTLFQCFSGLTNCPPNRAATAVRSSQPVFTLYPANRTRA